MNPTIGRDSWLFPLKKHEPFYDPFPPVQVTTRDEIAKTGTQTIDTDIEAAAETETILDLQTTAETTETPGTGIAILRDSAAIFKKVSPQYTM